jgi:hypothetical protein
VSRPDGPTRTARAWTSSGRGLGAVLAAVVLAACGVPRDDAPRALEPGEAPYASPRPSPVAEAAGDGRVGLYFVRGDDVVRTPRGVDQPVETPELLGLLLAGPTPEERETGLISVIPSTVTVQDVSTVGSTAVVTLGGPDSEVLRLQPLAYAQIVATLAPHRVSGVRFRLNDADLRVPRGDGSLTDAPLSREDYEQLLGPDATPSPTAAPTAPASPPLPASGGA